jgi:hypothetical protein
MNFDQFNTEPKLLVSDSLQDSLNEEQTSQIDDLFISAAIVTEQKENSLIGNLVGIEFSENPKIDIKSSLKNAFSFVGSVLLNENLRICDSVVLMHNVNSIKIPGPFQILNAKIIEIDPSNYCCVLAIDLIKIAADEKNIDG